MEDPIRTFLFQFKLIPFPIQILNNRTKSLLKLRLASVLPH